VKGSKEERETEKVAKRKRKRKRGKGRGRVTTFYLPRSQIRSDISEVILLAQNIQEKKKKKKGWGNSSFSIFS